MVVHAELWKVLRVKRVGIPDVVAATVLIAAHRVVVGGETRSLHVHYQGAQDPERGGG